MFSKKDSELPNKAWTLATRLTVVYALFAFAAIAVSSIVLYAGLVQNLHEEDAEFLKERLRVLSSLLTSGNPNRAMLEWEVETEWAGTRAPQTYTRVYRPDLGLFMETRGMGNELPDSVFPKPTDMNSEPETVPVHSNSGRTYWVLATRGPGGLVIQVAMDQTRDLNVVAEYRNRLMLVLAVALLASSIAGYEIARRGIRPLAQISETARTIRSSTLNERLNLAGLPAELATLAKTFNEMLDRLEQSFEQLNRFSADIAHELRTPLNNLRGEAEVALGRSRTDTDYREVLSSSLEEIDKLSRIIDSLLFLARAETPEMQIKAAPLDVVDELGKVKEFYEATASYRGIHLVVNAESPLQATVDRTLFQRAVGNLVSNAIAHTPNGGAITLRCGELAGSAWIEILDNGEGIAPEHLPHVFDRFYQADPARATNSGRSGLGLAIVQAIVRLHRGSVQIRSAIGSGTSVMLSFPCTAGPNITES